MLGGAGLLLGVVALPTFAALRGNASDDLLALGCSLDAGAFSCPAAQTSAAQSAHDRGVSYSLAANVSWVASSALVATSLLWALVRLSQAAPDRAARTVDLGCGLDRCALRVTF